MFHTDDRVRFSEHWLRSIYATSTELAGLTGTVIGIESLAAGGQLVSVAWDNRTRTRVLSSNLQIHE